MSCTLPNLRAALDRWARPSTWLLVAMGFAYFAPGLWDRHLRPKPWVTAEVEVREGQAGEVYFDSLTRAPLGGAAGRRLLWIEDESGAVLCTASRYDDWNGTRRRLFTFDAFFDDHCKLPLVPWRTCWEFSVETDFGNRATFGPDCTAFQEPPQAGPG